MPQDIAPQILVVDDARDIREPLALFLRQQGFRTRLAASAAEARTTLAEGQIHLVVLDIMMPGEDGLSLCRWIVQEKRAPVILLTALADGDDRIAGLDLGADDYVTKPFNPRELVSRINAVLRRVPPVQATPGAVARRFDGILHDPALSRLTLADGTEVELTTGENRLLGALLDHPGEVLTRARLLDLVRGREMRAYDRAADNIVSRLRRKIGDEARGGRVIVTEWGGGYRLAVPVEAAA